ncbi:MAG: hypothetical protein RIB52_07500 [Erythrobacter sp.]|uniref:hypothetical protein n=1 Tax=Erythrobacter sp. TaxID=1042 RepID=UPI0032ED8701
MTIRFAAASGTWNAPACAPIARGLVRRARERAANDNGSDTASEDGASGAARTRRSAPRRTRRDAPGEKVLRAALRHFAEHGLGAARAARVRAEAAFFAGDRAAYDWWLEVTRTLDRRLAAQVPSQPGAQVGPDARQPGA